MGRKMVTRFDRPDFARIAASADLPALVADDLGPPDRSGRWCCPFHDERTPSFGLTPDRRHFKCFGCGEGGDALDYVRLRDGLGLVEAARTLDPDAGPSRPTRRKAAGKSATFAGHPGSPAKVAEPERWRDPAWQAAVDELVCRAEATLWSPSGLLVRRWLQARGLADHTIRRFRLGFLPGDGRTRPVPRPDGTVGGLGFRRGVTIPWAAPGASYNRDEDGAGPTWCGLNVRRQSGWPPGRSPGGLRSGGCGGKVRREARGVCPRTCRDGSASRADSAGNSPMNYYNFGYKLI